MVSTAALLETRPGRRPLELPAGSPADFKPLGYFLGPEGATGLQVVFAEAAHRPSTRDVRDLWKRRHGGVASPLLLVVTYSHGGETKAAICGAMGDPPPLVFDLDPYTVARVADAALNEPNRHAAVRFLIGVIGELESELPGLRNEGLFAAHHLRTGVPARNDWSESCRHGELLLARRGRELIEALGFTAQPRDTATFTLRAGEEDTATAVAIFLDETETYEGVADRFLGNSPVSLALAKADADRLPFVVITRGSQIRIYAADKRIVGVGRKGRTETFLEANLALLPTESAGYVPLLFGAQALLPDGTFEQILERSKNYASDLSKRLRERVYTDVVPCLATAIARRSALAKALTEADLRFLYEETLFVLFRLVFIAYAEDKGLLPYATNDDYRRHALKTRAQRLAERWNEEGQLSFDEQATDLWSEAKQLFRAVDKGNSEWSVPAYDGGLFSSDAEVSPVGGAIAALELNNLEFGPALASLLVDIGDEGTYGAIDFRSLSVREFGTIYEGLLESSLSLAQSDLAMDKSRAYVPATAGDDVVVVTGEVYLHNQSGARKSSGAYFTKEFAVEHLLDHALEPALDEHVARLTALVDAGDEASAGEQFFDFRVADIAMGSGHFLVNVVDHIEARLTSFLTEHPLPVVNSELAILRNTALERLGDAAEGTEIEQAALVRRQVARRCVYGVDVNPIAVELARLALWIHTFVPGLPLSFLDRTLVCGNSLTGIGSLEEAVEAVEGHRDSDGVMSLASDQIGRYLEEARGPLRRLAHLTDATPADIAEARRAQAEALVAIAPASLVFDLAVAARLGEIEPLLEVSDDVLQHHPGAQRARGLQAELQALHFPIAFPEVFLRQRPGFDCILGNPPWEETNVDEASFWALRFPGLKSLTAGRLHDAIQDNRGSHPDILAEYERDVRSMRSIADALLAGPYKGMETGNPDLYKAFMWRFWQLCRQGGRIGVVLPRTALMTAGSAPWREHVLDHGQFSDVTLLLNNRQWVFEDVHPQYTIGLVSIEKSEKANRSVSLIGPFPSFQSYTEGTQLPRATFASDDFRTWSSGSAFPMLPSSDSSAVFLKLRRHPRLDARDGEWRTRPVQGDLNATTGKPDMIMNPDSSEGLLPVYSGATFDLWEPDTGKYYAWADPSHVVPLFLERRRRQRGRSNSVYSEFASSWLADDATLPMLHPRLAFRDVTNRTNQRTVIAALVPPRIVITNKAPFLLWPRGDDRDQAFLLGVLCSIPLDWYARRWVEISLNFHILNGFPVPRPSRNNALWQRVVEIAGRLAAVDDRYATWASAVGVPVGSVREPAEKAAMIAELDAAVALLYGLDERDVAHIFATFHVGWDFSDRLAAVLAHFHRLRALQ